MTIRPGLLGEIGALLRTLTDSRKAAIVTDSVVGPLYLGPVEKSLRESGFEVTSAIVGSGEDCKTIASVAEIYDQLLPARLDRRTPIIALGGGIIGDIAGFVAATILRGVPFVQVPTTLLAMVDASVGGKTGVNHAVGKNLIGAFHQPLAVLIDPTVLRTLPPRELRSGLAECIKHEIIRDADGFASLEKNISRALSLDLDYLGQLISHNVSIKAKVVAADPFENGERAHLNFGHTFGHAIENVLHYEYLHGECVALGMCAATELAVKLRMLDVTSRKRIVDLIQRAELPTTAKLDVDKVFEAMFYDKKVKAGKLRFVLPDRIGHVVIRDDVPPELVCASLESISSS